jgi:hypothetical protein
VVAGDSFSFRVRRDAANGSDTCTGIAYLVSVHITET